MSDEDLFALTGDWNAAAALRDEQNRALNQYLWSQPVETPSNVLSGNILAGASWHGLNTTLADELLRETGQGTTNVAVNGSTTGETLNQLNQFISAGGSFDPNATVYLQTGGVDFLLGYDKGVIKDNINQIVKTLGDQGVDVVLTGSPYAKSLQDVIDNKFDPKLDPIFNEIAKENKNVALVGVQGEILQNKNLVIDAVHTNAEGTAIYNQAVIDALSQFKNNVPSSTPESIAQIQRTNTVETTPPIITQAAASPVVAQSLATQLQNPNIQDLVSSGALQPNQATLIGDTYYQPVYASTGSGENFELGPLENVITYKAADNKTGGAYQQYTPTGELERTGTQQEVNATKDFMDFALTAGTLFGLPAGIGQSLGLSGVAGQAVGQGLLTTGTKLGGGDNLADALKAGLISGGLVYGGSQLSDLVSKSIPIDASNMTQAQFNDALEGNLVSEMQAAGLNKDQISAFLDDMGIGQGLTTAVTQPVAVSTPVTDGGAVNITAQNVPTTLNNVLSTISTVPNLNVTAQRPQQVSQDVLDAVTAQLVSNQAATPTVNVTAQKPTTVNDVIAALATTGLVSNVPTVSVTSNRPITSQADLNSVISSLVTTGTVTPTTTATTIPTVNVTAPKTTNIGDTLAAITTIPSTLTTTPVTTPKTTTTTTKETDPLKVAQLALSAAGLLGAGAALSNNGTTGFDVVPVPASWANPPAPSVAPYRPLAPINFGNRNLLIGTQWEKFLDPNYGQVPEPVQYSQPSNLSYNDLMGILGSKQGMPPASSLSINDIISGIQNQYGQAPARTMG